MQQLFVLAVFLVFLHSCTYPQPRGLMSESSHSSLHSSQSKLFSVVPPTDRPEIEFNMSDYQWQHRIALIFAPSEQSPLYQQQMEQWDASEGIQERELKLVEVLGTGAGSV